MSEAHLIERGEGKRFAAVGGIKTDLRPSLLEPGDSIAQQNGAPGEGEASRGYLPSVERDAKDLGAA